MKLARRGVFTTIVPNRRSNEIRVKTTKPPQKHSRDDYIKVKLATVLRAIYRAYISPTKSFRSYSQCGEDAVLRFLMQENLRTKGFYVDIGCHGPRRGNNTYWLYKRGWSGLLVDIEDEKIMSCRLARIRDTTRKCAVTDHEGTVKVYSEKPFSTTTTIIEPNVAKPGVRTSLTDVEATTLTKLLTDVVAPNRFALLSIDTEGSDLNVLKGLDFKKFRPIYICVEELYKDSIFDLEVSEVNKLLVHEGYRLASVAGFSLIYKLANSRAG